MDNAYDRASVTPSGAAITVIGLGPGGVELITRQAWDLLTRTDRVFLRTARHPAAKALPPGLTVESLDPLYDEAESFAALYETIAARLIAAAATGPVVYAVPGDPTMGEATVSALRRLAADAGLAIRILPGVSFVEPTLSALALDGLEGLQLLDALELAERPYPPVNPDLPALLAQVYNRQVASHLKLSLMALYPDEHEVALVHAAGSGDGRVEWLPLYAIDRAERVAHLTSLYLPPRPRPASLATLAETVAILRGPGGCPWDQEQTAQSLRPGFLEEMAEVLDALDRADDDSLREELGDLLFHIVIQAQIGRENDAFSLAEVIAGIDAKLKRRHPHVWGDVEVNDSDEVVRNWETLKANEKARPTHSLLNDLPASLPALASSQKIQARVRQIGFDWPDIAGVYAKLDEERQELQQAASPTARQAEMGDLLFTAVNLAIWLGLDAETALREANQRFTRRFRRLETLARRDGLDLADASLEAMNRLWEEAKSIPASDLPGPQEEAP